MLTVDEARAIVLAHARRLPDEDVGLLDALGRVLTRSVSALHHVPPFANSAMDGYAVRAGEAGRTLRVVGDSRAGAPFTGAVGDGEAVRISTGAAFPEGAEGVLQVELVDVDEEAGQVTLRDAVTPGRNVRGAGGDVEEGETPLAAGTLVGASEIGVAASMGHPTLRCTRRPRIIILATGDELVPPGRPLGPGQIHEANLLTLSALASGDGAEIVRAENVADTPEATRDAIERALQDADLLLLSGGVSVGPHDHVKPALDEQGVQEVFWRVALRPGKPTWFGTHGETLVLGLPGNPVSTMVTYLLFARPAIRQMRGIDPRARTLRATLTEAVPRADQREEMVRVTLDGDRAIPTGVQDSHRLTSMLRADGLARIPAGSEPVAAGQKVEVELLGPPRGIAWGLVDGHAGPVARD
jgi:molybdopterin molybdotransferase